MSRAARMKPVLEQAEREEEHARRQLAGSQQSLDDAVTQIGELEQYEQSYLTQMREQSQSITTAATYHSYHTFLAKLAQAIRQQAELIELKHRQQQAHLLQWQSASAKFSNMSEFIDRLRQEEAAAADKRQQQALDEVSMQRFAADTARRASAARKARAAKRAR